MDLGNSKEPSLGVEPGNGLKGRGRSSLRGSKVPVPSAHGLQGAVEGRKHRELLGRDEVGRGGGEKEVAKDQAGRRRKGRRNGGKESREKGKGWRRGGRGVGRSMGVREEETFLGVVARAVWGQREADCKLRTHPQLHAFLLLERLHGPKRPEPPLQNARGTADEPERGGVSIRVGPGSHRAGRGAERKAGKDLGPV